MRSIITGAVALVGAAALSACATSAPTPGGASSGGPATAPATTAATAPAGTTPKPTTAATTTPATTTAAARPTAGRTPAKAPTSDVSQLKRLGITLGAGVLIDVADDGLNRYLVIGRNGVVDFTGTTRTDATMMSLKAAPVGEKNRVVIKPPFYNEDLGAGSCVAATSGAALRLETCVTGKTSQIWTVVPAGDSGQFELHGSHGVVRFGGRTGLQTIPYAR
jgi:hypothetical protein